VQWFLKRHSSLANSAFDCCFQPSKVSHTQIFPSMYLEETYVIKVLHNTGAAIFCQCGEKWVDWTPPDTQSLMDLENSLALFTSSGCNWYTGCKMRISNFRSSFSKQFLFLLFYIQFGNNNSLSYSDFVR